jgi:hypothetical protein
MQIKVHEGGGGLLQFLVAVPQHWQVRRIDIGITPIARSLGSKGNRAGGHVLENALGVPANVSCGAGSSAAATEVAKKHATQATKPMIFCAFIVCSPCSNECLIYRTTETRYSAPRSRNLRRRR